MTDKKKVAKKTTKKTEKKEAVKKLTETIKKVEVVKKEKPTFESWWTKTYGDHINMTIALTNHLGINLKYNKARKDYGLNLTEKELCERIWNDYA